MRFICQPLVGILMLASAAGAEPPSSLGDGQPLPSFSAQTDRDERDKIALADLPAPPPELARLIKSGRVSFESGGQASPQRLSTGAGLAAETAFEIRYHFDSQQNWRLATSGGRRELVISVQIGNVQWEPSHVVWFRSPPPDESFWDSPLVRHEFDHVRLSSDQRLRKSFEDTLARTRLIRLELPRSVPITSSFVRRQVVAYVEAVFQQTVELVEIRYQELDRLTRHGLLSLPQDAALAEILAHSDAVEPQQPHTNEPPN